MARLKRFGGYTSSGDDSYLFVVRRDMSGGQNNRQHPSIIGENQADTLTNVDISVGGERRRRQGTTLLEDLGATAITGLATYDPQGFSPNLMATTAAALKRWPNSSTFQDVSITMSSGLPTTMFKAYKTGVGDCLMIGNGTDNWQEMAPDYSVTDLGSTAGTASDSPPASTVGTFYRSRMWVLKNDLLYFSDAAPSDYSTAFNTTTNYYRLPVGSERAILGTRDYGLIVMGKEQIWGLNPSTTPAATDKPEKLLGIGCAAGNTAVQVGDDYLFMAFDGVRGLKRTLQDNLQLGQSYPLSYPLKEEFDEINWAYIHNACACYFDNKYFIALPTAGAAYNNKVWVYYPASQAWTVITGWNVGAWAVHKVNGEERLYYGEASADGKIYRAWYGASDNGTAINFTEIGRSEDLGQPIKKKVGGEFKVLMKPAGNYNVTVQGSFDNGSFSTLGTMNISSNLVTFPVTFPVTFYPDQTVYKKFHLDSYGPWYQFKHKVLHNAVTSNADDVTIYETSLTSHLEEYIAEEEA
jgi:hypothetical protein